MNENEMLSRARQEYERGVALRQQARFGEAVNAFMFVIKELDGVEKGEDLSARAKASIELINEIVGFVNTDLMNP